MTVFRRVTSWLTGLLVAPGLLLASAQVPVSPDYPVECSMSTMARFPWIFTAVSILSTDLAGRPLLATRTPKRGTQPVEVDDPALDLLEKPNAAVTGHLFRKQLWTDFLLCGNCFIWRPEGAASVAIYRLHPASMRPVPGPMGMVAGYEYTDAETSAKQILPPEQVIHIRDVSWQDDSRSLLGESPIRCLHDDLLTEMGARITAKEAAKKGRPDMLFSTDQQLGPGGAKEVVKRWQEAMADRNAAFVIGQGMKAEKLSWSPKELDFTDQRHDLRDTTLAVLGVPPSRAGVPSANYATARQEEKTYWERCMGRCRIFDDAFSVLAQPGIRISHDFSGIEALQVGYEARQVRVINWVALGMDPNEAGAYENFEGLPKMERAAAPDTDEDGDASGEDVEPGVTDDEPNEPADKAIWAAVWLHLRVAEASYAGLGDGLDTRLLVRSLTETLFRGLDETGMHPTAARAWAEDIATTTDEAARMGLDGAFTDARCRRLTQRIAHSLRRAAA